MSQQGSCCPARRAPGTAATPQRPAGVPASPPGRHPRHTEPQKAQAAPPRQPGPLPGKTKAALPTKARTAATSTGCPGHDTGWGGHTGPRTAPPRWLSQGAPSWLLQPLGAPGDPLSSKERQMHRASPTQAAARSIKTQSPALNIEMQCPQEPPSSCQPGTASAHHAQAATTARREATALAGTSRPQRHQNLHVCSRKQPCTSEQCCRRLSPWLPLAAASRRTRCKAAAPTQPGGTNSRSRP